eukprot:4933900-Pleurochrysis_carterae.AAC.1
MEPLSAFARASLFLYSALARVGSVRTGARLTVLAFDQLPFAVCQTGIPSCQTRIGFRQMCIGLRQMRIAFRQMYIEFR